MKDGSYKLVVPPCFARIYPCALSFRYHHILGPVTVAFRCRILSLSAFPCTLCGPFAGMPSIRFPAPRTLCKRTLRVISASSVYLVDTIARFLSSVNLFFSLLKFNWQREIFFCCFLLPHNECLTLAYCRWL